MEVLGGGFDIPKLVLFRDTIIEDEALSQAFGIWLQDMDKKSSNDWCSTSDDWSGLPANVSSTQPVREET